jgi:hypothetical protein
MNAKQEAALRSLCERYNVRFVAAHYHPQFDLPPGYVAGWVGGIEHAPKPSGRNSPKVTIYVGCSPEGEISS